MSAYTVKHCIRDSWPQSSMFPNQLPYGGVPHKLYKIWFQSVIDLLIAVFTNDNTFAFVVFVTVLLITLARSQSGIQHRNKKSQGWGRMKQQQKFKIYCRDGRSASLQMLLVLNSEYCLCSNCHGEKKTEWSDNGYQGFKIFFPSDY